MSSLSASRNAWKKTPKAANPAPSLVDGSEASFQSALCRQPLPEIEHPTTDMRDALALTITRSADAESNRGRNVYPLTVACPAAYIF